MDLSKLTSAMNKRNGVIVESASDPYMHELRVANEAAMHSNLHVIFNETGAGKFGKDPEDDDSEDAKKEYEERYGSPMIDENGFGDCYKNAKALVNTAANKPDYAEKMYVQCQNLIRRSSDGTELGLAKKFIDSLNFFSSKDKTDLKARIDAKKIKLEGGGFIKSKTAYLKRQFKDKKEAKINASKNESAVDDRACTALLEAVGLEVNHITMQYLPEDARIKVTDEALTKLMKFITDKYNALDFQEIERSAGDIEKFKYTKMIKDNLKTLMHIYSTSDEDGAKKYVETVSDAMEIMDMLYMERIKFSTLYTSGNGIVQLLYNSLVAAELYTVGILVSNTIRLVTSEVDTECQVLFDEIPGTIKHVHIRNIQSAAKSRNIIVKILEAFYGDMRKKPTNEAVITLGATIGILSKILLGAGIVGGVFWGIPAIINLIREIVYSIYFARVSIAEMCQVQIDLINMNIESLEAGRGTKVVIARQKKIVDKLEKWKNRVAVKMDMANTLTHNQTKRENNQLRIYDDSPLVQSTLTDDNGLML